MKHTTPAIIVVGGGHAGCEAAAAAARMGANVTMVTQNPATIGVMSCNPAIGGVGKGHLVREVDALGGLMGQVADASGIQFRLLNRSKGPAVQGPRAQMDREVYRTTMQQVLRSYRNLRVVQGSVIDVIVKNATVIGVELGDGNRLLSDAVILTTGTFLNGVIHIGGEMRKAGRDGEDSQTQLADRLAELELPLGRLKTGTPPRLDGSTIDWTAIEKQDGDEHPVMLSFLSKKPALRQISCGMTGTTDRTHEIVRSSLDKSALFNGHISGKGPRYCPSIEDKISRFPDNASHRIFLEPEGLYTKLVYPNGISTSLPGDVQASFVKSIPGLEGATIVKPGYAIEYDYVNPTALDRGFQLRNLNRLWLAGQINGTTGYEEAAAQGLVAAIAAVQASRGHEPYVFSRANSYIGVLIDDLTTRGVSEPYRMFTSRSEYRLSLRPDNADQRLCETGVSLGLLSADRQNAFREKMTRLRSAYELLLEIKVDNERLRELGASLSLQSQRRNGLDALALKGIDLNKLASVEPRIGDIPCGISEQISCEVVYRNYLPRQSADMARYMKNEGTKIPPGADFQQVPGLSRELCEKLDVKRPTNFAEAASIEGMTPAALNVLLLHVRRLDLVQGA